MIPGIAILGLAGLAIWESRNEIKHRAERFKCWLCRDEGCWICRAS